MSLNIKSDQAYAYAELLEVLSLMEEEYVNRIPKKLLNVFETNKASNYSNHINAEIPLEEQEISEKTSALLAMLMLNYWCDSEEQKQNLKNTFEENERKYQKELKEKYNPDNIFKKDNLSQTSTIAKEISTDSEQSVNNISNNSAELPMDYSSFPWYKKVITKIKTFIYNLFKGQKTPT